MARKPKTSKAVKQARRQKRAEYRKRRWADAGAKASQTRAYRDLAPAVRRAPTAEELDRYAVIHSVSTMRTTY